MLWVVTVENRDVDGGRPRRVGELKDLGPADAIEAARRMVGATTCGDAVSVMSESAWKLRCDRDADRRNLMYNFGHRRGNLKGENAPHARLTADAIRAWRQEVKGGAKAADVARRESERCGLAYTTLLYAIQGRTWSWLQ